MSGYRFPPMEEAALCYMPLLGLLNHHNMQAIDQDLEVPWASILLSPKRILNLFPTSQPSQAHKFSNL
jgi:hypothetical protein